MHNLAGRLHTYAHKVHMNWDHEQSQDKEARKRWLQKFNAAIAPLLNFDIIGNLQFREAMYITHAVAVLYTKTRPYRMLKNMVTRKFEYARVDATKRSPRE